MKVYFVNNNGGGFAGRVDVSPDMSVGEFFAREFPDGNPDSYKIRVNRENVTRDYVLQDEDRVTVTPTNVKGA